MTDHYLDSCMENSLSEELDDGSEIKPDLRKYSRRPIYDIKIEENGKVYTMLIKPSVQVKKKLPMT